MEKLKPIFSTVRYLELSGAASRFVVEFTKEIRPILLLFGSLDNESILKYSRCISTKEIFDDLNKRLNEAVAKNEAAWKATYQQVVQEVTKSAPQPQEKPEEKAN